MAAMSAVLDVAGWVLVTAGWVTWILLLIRRSDRAVEFMNGLFALGDGTWAVENSLRGDWVQAGIFAAAAGICGLAWWMLRRRNRRRRRALAELGAKSRAGIEALAATLRERMVPRRVLSPVPGGAS